MGLYFSTYKKKALLEIIEFGLKQKEVNLDTKIKNEYNLLNEILEQHNKGKSKKIVSFLSNILRQQYIHYS